MTGKLWPCFLLFVMFEYIGGIVGTEIDQYLGVQMKGGAVAISFHVLYQQFWGAITATLLYFFVK